MRIRAGLTLGAKPSKVKQTQAATNMSLSAKGAQLAESTIVMFTWRKTGLLSDVLVQTVVAVGTISGAGEGLAFGHATQVVFVQILALHPLFTETLEKMFADQRPVCSGRRKARCSGGRGRYAGGSWVSVGTGRTQRAMALAVGLANRYIAGKTKAKTFAEEGSKGEVIVSWIARGLGGEHARGSAMDVSHVDGTASRDARRQLCDQGKVQSSDGCEALERSETCQERWQGAQRSRNDYRSLILCLRCLHPVDTALDQCYFFVDTPSLSFTFGSSAFFES